MKRTLPSPAIESDKFLVEKFSGSSADRDLMTSVVHELTDLAFDARDAACRAIVTDAGAALDWLELGFDLDAVLGHVLRTGAATVGASR